jgi:hypothetical protein
VSETNRSDLEFDVVCIATLPGPTLLVGVLGLALLRMTPQEFSKEPTCQRQ